MLKRRSSVGNCCRIESSNRLNSIFIKFNFFIFYKYFCTGGPGPSGPPPRSATVNNSWRHQHEPLTSLNGYEEYRHLGILNRPYNTYTVRTRQSKRLNVNISLRFVTANLTI